MLWYRVTLAKLEPVTLHSKVIADVKSIELLLLVGDVKVTVKGVL